MSLIFSEETTNSSQTPVFVRLMKFGRLDADRVESVHTSLESRLISNRQVQKRGMVIGRATKLVGVLSGSVTGLHGLLRDGEIAARDAVQVRLGGEVLQLHGVSLVVDGREDRSIIQQTHPLYTFISS